MQKSYWSEVNIGEIFWNMYVWRKVYCTSDQRISEWISVEQFWHTELRAGHLERVLVSRTAIPNKVTFVLILILFTYWLQIWVQCLTILTYFKIFWKKMGVLTAVESWPSGERERESYGISTSGMSSPHSPAQIQISCHYLHENETNKLQRCETTLEKRRGKLCDNVLWGMEHYPSVDVVSEYTLHTINIMHL